MQRRAVLLEQAQRRAEHLEREDAAPRLTDVVPTLVGLRLHIEERRGDGTDLIVHTRHIVVARAPALFRLPCNDKDCTDGGHDLTRVMMRALEATSTEFEGVDVCRGGRGPTDCGRELKFTAIAAYQVVGGGDRPR